ncbi:MAG: Uma2 family endonuclease [Candidatus Anammoximicrobium sp.]|nr:Uma2 family endonuclease [Candidatus Anammoximicrobium sp.]
MSTAAVPRQETRPAKRIPPLQAGDRLTRAEFERRYRSMPQVNKAELIEGVVYMPSPVSNEGQSSPHFDLITVLGIYRSQTPGIQGGDNGTVLLDLDNEPQPDVFMRILPQYGGQSGDRGDYVEGAPELVAEVTSSSASYDLHDKLRAYRRNGVCEYVVWRVWDGEIDWFVLREEVYQRLTPTAEGVYRSEVFPGFFLDAAALVAGNLAQAIQVVQQGLNSPEHAEFVARLQQARNQIQSQAPQP